jgi:DinB family protein
LEDVLSQIRTVLTTTPARWQQLTGTLPTDLLRRAPAVGEWSAADCLKHLLDTERFVFPVRVHAFLEGQERFAAFDPDAQPAPAEPPSAAEMAVSFAQARTQNLTLLASVAAGDLGRSAVHGELGPVTLGQMLHEWAAHDLMHTVQAERALMQPFIAESGAWQVYFRDHIAHEG